MMETLTLKVASASISRPLHMPSAILQESHAHLDNLAHISILYFKDQRKHSDLPQFRIAL